MEVQSSKNGHLGVIATKAYAPGDVICTETTPLLCLAPRGKSQQDKLISAFETQKGKSNSPSSAKKKPTVSFWQSMNVPSSIPESFRGTFKGMVQAAMCWNVLYGDKEHAETREKFLKLYCPSLKEPSQAETGIVDIARKALRYIADHDIKTDVTKEEETLYVMLIWACNAFEQGRVYERISRFNHSCSPNAIVQPILGDDGNHEGQRIVAAAPIAVGAEVCISYLGLLLYAERAVRQEHLLQTKYFRCACVRCICTSGPDMAAAVPCFQCHDRVGRQLEEDVQYDDEQNVNYTAPQQQEDGSIIFYCAACKTKLSIKDESCAKYVTAGEKVVQKTVTFLREYDQQQNQRLVNDENNDVDDDDDDEVQDEMLDHHIRMASSILGAKHWTTNLLLLLQVDRNLQTLHGAMLTAESSPSKTSTPDLDSIAATVDSLERIIRFVQGLDGHLKLHMGHLVGDVIIGLARALVALGDPKSQTYAAEWLEKIDDDYVQRFASPGLQKVVVALKTAWQHASSESSKPPAKKVKR